MATADDSLSKLDVSIVNQIAREIHQSAGAALSVWPLMSHDARRKAAVVSSQRALAPIASLPPEVAGTALMVLLGGYLEILAALGEAWPGNPPTLSRCSDCDGRVVASGNTPHTCRACSRPHAG